MTLWIFNQAIQVIDVQKLPDEIVLFIFCLFSPTPYNLSENEIEPFFQPYNFFCLNPLPII